MTPGIPSPKTPGIHVDIPAADYHAWPAFGSSDLKAMRQGPPSLVMWRRWNPPDPTDAMRLGTAVHMAIIEPARFDATYVEKPEDMSFATKDGKAWKERHEGREILTFKQAETVRGVVEAFNLKREAARSIVNADREVSLLWSDPATGLLLKGRPDWINDGYLYDLKLSRYASERSIPFRAWAEGWMHQAAQYRTGLNLLGQKIKGCRLVVVHPQAPHPTYLIELKENDLDLLALENAETVRHLAECQATGIWVGTSDEWTAIDLPPTALVGSLGMLDMEPENA